MFSIPIKLIEKKKKLLIKKEDRKFSNTISKNIYKKKNTNKKLSFDDNISNLILKIVFIKKIILKFISKTNKYFENINPKIIFVKFVKIKYFDNNNNYIKSNYFSIKALYCIQKQIIYFKLIKKFTKDYFSLNEEISLFSLISTEESKKEFNMFLIKKKAKDYSKKFYIINNKLKIDNFIDSNINLIINDNESLSNLSIFHKGKLNKDDLLKDSIFKSSSFNFNNDKFLEIEVENKDNNLINNENLTDNYDEELEKKIILVQKNIRKFIDLSKFKKKVKSIIMVYDKIFYQQGEKIYFCITKLMIKKELYFHTYNISKNYNFNSKILKIDSNKDYEYYYKIAYFDLEQREFYINDFFKISNNIIKEKIPQDQLDKFENMKNKKLKNNINELIDKNIFEKVDTKLLSKKTFFNKNTNINDLLLLFINKEINIIKLTIFSKYINNIILNKTIFHNIKKDFKIKEKEIYNIYNNSFIKYYYDKDSIIKNKIDLQINNQDNQMIYNNYTEKQLKIIKFIQYHYINSKIIKSFIYNINDINFYIKVILMKNSKKIIFKIYLPKNNKNYLFDEINKNLDNLYDFFQNIIIVVDSNDLFVFLKNKKLFDKYINYIIKNNLKFKSYFQLKKFKSKNIIDRLKYKLLLKKQKIKNKNNEKYNFEKEFKKDYNFNIKKINLENTLNNDIDNVSNNNIKDFDLINNFSIINCYNEYTKKKKDSCFYTNSNSEFFEKEFNYNLSKFILNPKNNIKKISIDDLNSPFDIKKKN